MRLPVAIVIATLLAAPVKPGAAARSEFGSRQQEDALMQRARETGLNEGWREADALAHSRAHRRGETLNLPLANRPPLLLKDNRPACTGDDNTPPVSECRVYQLVGELATHHLYVVNEAWYEGCGTVHLIDTRSGRDTKLAEIPVFSPDDDRLLVQNECEADDSISDNHFEIWKRRGDGWALEWAYRDTQAYRDDPTLQNPFHSDVVSWQSDNITLSFVVPAFGNAQERHWTGTLYRRHGRWLLKAGKLHSP